MKILRNGDKESLEKIFVVGLKDSSKKSQDYIDSAKALDLGIQSLKFQDMTPPPAQGSAAQSGNAGANGNKQAAPSKDAAPVVQPTPITNNPDQHLTKIE